MSLVDHARLNFTKGSKLYVKYAEGHKLTLKEAILAKCAECTNFYADGARDCEIEDCPLYGYMPYGKAWKNREKKPISEELRAKLQARMIKMQSKVQEARNAKKI